VTRGADFTLHFFDVGQGDSALAQCGRTQALIDGGPDRIALGRLGRAMPFTDRRIEYVILSHPHDDHVFGLFAVLERYEVGRLFVSKYVAEVPLGAKLIELARRRGTEIVTVKSGDSIAFGDCGAFKVLWPDGRAEDIIRGESDSANDQSVVLELLTDEKALALLTGDISGEVERALLVGDSFGDVPVLKVAHHGSRYSSAAEFVHAVRPEFAVISVGENRYGHPSESTVFRLQANGAQVRRTDLDGNTIFTVQPDGTVNRLSN
jgi:competence protein ComEC